ncbi:hypothetical protein [Streptomyces sp. NPDC051452]|uniref:hypothetical protein n=1 Tax=Streptomyces sp. NPDC051452 TaxID=3365654 RepID=UPI00378AE45F
MATEIEPARRATYLDPFDGRPAWEIFNEEEEKRRQEEASEAAEARKRPEPANEDGSGLTQAQAPAPQQSGAVGRNGLVLINDLDWVDMTDRNWDYMGLVFRSSLNATDKVVLGVVARHCGVNSYGCTASNETLANEANVEKANFRKRLSRLTKEGWVRENGSMPAPKGKKDGTKIRHIGVKRAWLQGGGS